jgi:hypothetical protein
MRQLLTAICLILLIPILSGLKAERQGLILWDSSRKLQWSDFKGTNQGNFAGTVKDTAYTDGQQQVYMHIETEAYCYHQISFGASYKFDTIRFTVQTWFDPAKSWTKNSTAYLLNHEQRHFDIGELTAREFRKYLSDSVKEWNDAAQKRIFARFSAQNQAAQSRYDSITEHSILVEKQEWYNHYIDSTLDAYRDYAAPDIVIYAPAKRRQPVRTR